jgi:chitin disaccharide deacetylase
LIYGPRWAGFDILIVVLYGRVQPLKRLIVTADDFGLAPAINQAVEEAHCNGILSAASLMVAAPAAADAVARARRLPRLGVGLHLVLVDGAPCLPPEQVPALVGTDGRFPDDVFGLGIKMFWVPAARRQVAAELRAQLEAFRRTGLRCDHVDAHHHFHLHPVVLQALLRLAPEFGVTAVRVPYEPPFLAWRATGDRLGARLAAWLVQGRRAQRMKRRLQAAGIACNDWLLGLSDSGGMTKARVHGYLRDLPEGVSELYVHPAIERWSGPGAWPTSYDGRAEFEALTDPETRSLLARQGVEPTTFAALTVAGG